MTTNLEYYRKQAKALLKAATSGDATAVERIHRYSSQLKLHSAQLTIARERGFASWARLREAALQSARDEEDAVAAFVIAATSELEKAEEMLARKPELAKAGFYAALVLGDHAAVREALSKSSKLARDKSGPENVEPLVYVCFSRFANRRSKRAGDLAETARALLSQGADPNTAFNDPQWKDNPLPCLYAATGLNNNAALARVLLEAGANPNDGESLYHSTEHADHECLRLLLSHGGKPDSVYVLLHVLDHEDAEGVRLLLAHGADPRAANVRGETPLHWAVWRGRSAGILGMLLDHGAEIDAKRHDGRTAYAIALESGKTKVAEFLAGRGANTAVTALDRYLMECTAASAEELERLLREPPAVTLTPEDHRMLPDLTINHSTASVRGLLAVGVPVDARGENGGTALHWACWKGYSDIVKVLLAQGASLTITDTQFQAPPPGWFGHGIQNCGGADGDYPQVARELVAAGAVFAKVDFPSGNVGVDAVLRSLG